MLKNLKLINEVVMEQRQLTTMLVARLYRLLKSNNKIMDGPEYQTQTNLRDVTKKQLKEIFESLDKVLIFLFKIISTTNFFKRTIKDI